MFQKKINRFAHAQTLYFILEDGEQEIVVDAERENHDVLWFTKDELKKFLTPETHFRALDMLHGVVVYTGEGLLTNSGKFNGLSSEEAKEKITNYSGGKWSQPLSFVTGLLAVSVIGAAQFQ